MTADPSPARVAADRGRTERRAADTDAATRREALRARCPHGALRARAAEPFAGPIEWCLCCRSWFGTLHGPGFCPECRDWKADPRTQEAAVTVEPALPVPAATLERQEDAESREDRISDEAVTAATEAVEASLRQYPITRNAFDARLGWGASVEEIATVALAVAVPHLERRIRESIAGEIEAASSESPTWDVDASWTFERKAVLDHAARIARGSSS